MLLSEKPLVDSFGTIARAAADADELRPAARDAPFAETALGRSEAGSERCRRDQGVQQGGAAD